MSVTRPVAAKDTDTPNTISAELIGQVYNPSPTVSAQYGYVSYLKGLDTSAITSPGGTLSERSAPTPVMPSGRVSYEDMPG